MDLGLHLFLSWFSARHSKAIFANRNHKIKSCLSRSHTCLSVDGGLPHCHCVEMTIDKLVQAGAPADTNCYGFCSTYTHTHVYYRAILLIESLTLFDLPTYDATCGTDKVAVLKKFSSRTSRPVTEKYIIIIILLILFSVGKFVSSFF